MAVSPTLVKIAVQALATKDGRKIILMSILGPIVFLFLLISLFAYVISAPSQWLAKTFGFSSNENAIVQNVQAQYRNYIKPENKYIDRGGFFVYPTDGTTGNRGFSAIPVPHPVLIDVTRPHWGQDFNSQWHSNIYSIADGQVVDLGINEETGMYITIYHNEDSKKFYTRYLHLSGIHALPDAEVKQGDVIASEGGEPNKNAGQPFDMYPGISTGHHLHFEVREGSSYSSAIPVDPKLYIDPIPVEITCSAKGCSKSDSDGSITITLKGGRDRGFDVSSDGGTSWTTISSKTYTISDLSSGDYRVVARDASYIKNISRISTVHIDSKPVEPEEDDNEKKDKDKKPKTVPDINKNESPKATSNTNK